MMGLKSIWQKLYATLASVRTGIFLIIVVGVCSAVGTIILQRPTTDPEEMVRSYTPETLAMLDRLGLTDIFHSWWFLTLLCLFCLCLIFVSLDRWPNAWKAYSKPVRFAAPHVRGNLPQEASFPVSEEEGALQAAERALRRFGFKPERVSESGSAGLFSQSQRFSVFAVYVVHLSLLFIFAGYIVDGIIGYHGNLNVPEGQALGVMSVRDNHGNESKRQLPFLIRCDAAGMEAYADGSPKKWWSKLAIIKDGKQVAAKTIQVNDPLVYGGIRIYQSSMGQSPFPKTITFLATPAAEGDTASVELPLNGAGAPLPDGESVGILRWVPNYYVQDGQIYNKNDNPEHPAIQLGLTDARGQTTKLWIMPSEKNTTAGQVAPYVFSIKSATWNKFTGLEIAHHPGQAGVWIGVVLMAIGLVIAFYTQHVRLWAAVADDGNGGMRLWIGGTANKNRDRLQIKFGQLKTALAEELSRAGLSQTVQTMQEQTVSQG